MSRPVKFYLDEHIARAVARQLRRRGADVRTVSEAGLMGASDEKHLERASAEGRVLVTQDEDFLCLHESASMHAGIVYFPQGTAVGELIRGLSLIHEVLYAADMAGKVQYM